MLRDGFLRFCNDPEIACCKAERELEQLRAENASNNKRLKDAATPKWCPELEEAAQAGEGERADI